MLLFFFGRDWSGAIQRDDLDKKIPRTTTIVHVHMLLLCTEQQKVRVSQHRKASDFEKGRKKRKPFQATTHLN